MIVHLAKLNFDKILLCLIWALTLTGCGGSSRSSPAIDLFLDQCIQNIFDTANLERDLALLRVLECSNQNISSIRGLESATNLLVLSLPGNQLTDADLRDLPSLEYIDFSTNQLASINLTGLTELHVLIVPGNELAEIQSEVFEFPKLEYLDLRDNPWVEYGAVHEIANIFNCVSSCSEGLTGNWLETSEFGTSALVLDAAGQANITLKYVDENANTDSQLQYASTYTSDQGIVAIQVFDNSYNFQVLANTASRLILLPSTGEQSLTLDVPFNSNKLAQLDPLGDDFNYSDIWAEGDYAYLGTFEQGVKIIDISDVSAPKLLATYTSSSNQFNDIKVQQGIGYFASEVDGLHIVDLADANKPALLARFDASQGGFDGVHNVFVDGDFLYQTDSQTAVVKVINISDPSAPFLLGNIVTSDPWFIHDVTVVNSRLYTSGFGGTTFVYDVSDVATSAPLLGQINTGSYSHSNWVNSDGTILASARETGNGDVRLYDISNLANPVLLSTITPAAIGKHNIIPHNVVIDGNRLYVSWYQAGLMVFDIQQPANPLLIASFDSHENIATLFVGSTDFNGNFGVYPFLGGDKILLSDVKGGLFIVDTSLGW